MFSFYRKHHTLALAIFFSYVYADSGFASNDIFSANDVPGTKFTATARNYEPDSGGKGQPTTMTTIGGSRGGIDVSGLTAYIPSNYMIDANNPHFKWKINKTVKKPIMFLIISKTETDPVFEKYYPSPNNRGHKTTISTPLKQGDSYTWIMFICETSTCLNGATNSIRVTFTTY